MKHNKELNIKHITYKIEINPSDIAKEMLKKNCEYRHFLYNKCVEIIKNIEENHNTLMMDAYALLNTIRDDYEKNILNDKRPLYLEEYDYYFRGISECVVDDVNSTCRRIITNRKKGNPGNLHFMKYDPNNLGFRFKNKLNTKCKCVSTGLYTGSRLQLTNNPYLIGLKINQDMGILAIHLKESIEKFHIDLNKIRGNCN